MELYIRSERDQMKKIISKILIVILLISSCIGTINVAPVTVIAAKVAPQSVSHMLPTKSFRPSVIVFISVDLVNV